MTKAKKIVCIALIITGIVLAAVCFASLPDEVAVQFDLHGEVSSTMAKPVAVILPLGMALAGGIIDMCNNEKSCRGIALAAVGIAVMVFMLVVNR